MAQLNLTITQEEMQALLQQDQSAAFRELLRGCLNSILQAESAEQLKAAPYERTESRTDSRNGSRERTLNTRIGQIVLQVPRHREVPFKTLVFENYSRSEGALITTMAEMVVNGTSSRKVGKVMETLCGKAFSKSTVSDACKELDRQVEAFRNRPINGRYPFMTVDATYFKVRENHRITSKALMIAYGINEEGKREILGFASYEKESKETWKAFLMDLKKRGLNGLLMVVSDGHEGIRYALDQVFPGVAWQRCQFHFSKNISEKAPQKYQAAIRAELQELFNSGTIEAARAKRDEILSEYQDVAEAAMKCLEEGFEDSMTVMTLPAGMRKCFRTSNHIERLNRELKRRSNVIGVFPNEQSLLRLMGSVLIERNELIQTYKAVFSRENCQALRMSDVPKMLSEIADVQHSLRTV